MIVEGCVSFAVGAVAPASSASGQRAIATDLQLHIPGHGDPVQVHLPGLALGATSGAPFAVGVTAYEKGCLESPPTATAGPAAGSACSAGQLAASAAAPSGSVRRPFSVVRLRNTSHTTCSITGYPSIALRGKQVSIAGASTKLPSSGRASVRVAASPTSEDLRVAVHAGIPERTDHGARPVVLAPGQSASFALGTADGSAHYRSRFLVQSVQFSLPGNLGRTTVSIPGQLFAESSTQAQLPVGVTAFAAGVDAGQ